MMRLCAVRKKKHRIAQNDVLDQADMSISLQKSERFPISYTWPHKGFKNDTQTSDKNWANHVNLFFT